MRQQRTITPKEEFEKWWKDNHYPMLPAPIGVDRIPSTDAIWQYFQDRHREFPREAVMSLLQDFQHDIEAPESRGHPSLKSCADSYYADKIERLLNGGRKPRTDLLSSWDIKRLIESNLWVSKSETGHEIKGKKKFIAAIFAVLYPRDKPAGEQPEYEVEINEDGSLKPVCSTCRGSKEVPFESLIPGMKPCPKCTEKSKDARAIISEVITGKTCTVQISNMSYAHLESLADFLGVSLDIPLGSIDIPLKVESIPGTPCPDCTELDARLRVGNFGGLKPRKPREGQRRIKEFEHGWVDDPKQNGVFEMDIYSLDKGETWYRDHRTGEERRQ